MKGYSEHRGCATQLVFEAATGQFVERKVVHGFDSTPPKKAEVILLAGGKKLTPQRGKGQAHWLAKQMV